MKPVILYSYSDFPESKQEELREIFCENYDVSMVAYNEVMACVIEPWKHYLQETYGIEVSSIDWSLYGQGSGARIVANSGANHNLLLELRKEGTPISVKDLVEFGEVNDIICFAEFGFDRYCHEKTVSYVFASLELEHLYNPLSMLMSKWSREVHDEVVRIYEECFEKESIEDLINTVKPLFFECGTFAMFDREDD